MCEKPKDKPNELQRYEEKLREATFHYNRAEDFSSKGKQGTANTFYNKSESVCEDALELLQEILPDDGYLRIWFYTDISFKCGSDLSADIVSLPCLVNSRSKERLKDHSRITSKQDVKLSVAERATDAIGREAAVRSKSDSFILEKLLNTKD